MANLSVNLPWRVANTQWASVLNPILSNPLNNGNILQNVSLIEGTNVLNHYLGRVQQGWIITDQQGIASIYRPNTSPFNNLTLTLVSSAAVIVSIGVF